MGGLIRMFLIKGTAAPKDDSGGGLTKILSGDFPTGANVCPMPEAIMAAANFLYTSFQGVL